MNVEHSENNDECLHLSAKHILLVEDDSMVREHVECLLTDLGYRVTSVENARQCLDTIDHLEQVDLLFSDIVMPGGMSGTQLAQEIRRSYPELPILLTSGYAEDVFSGLNVSDGAIALLRKPYRRNDLHLALEGMLSRT